MFGVERAATAVLVALISMPLLTELVSPEDAVCYKHGAPSGAVRRAQRPFQPTTTNNHSTRTCRTYPRAKIGSIRARSLAPRPWIAGAVGRRRK